MTTDTASVPIRQPPTYRSSAHVDVGAALLRAAVTRSVVAVLLPVLIRQPKASSPSFNRRQAVAISFFARAAASCDRRRSGILLLQGHLICCALTLFCASTRHRRIAETSITTRRGHPICASQSRTIFVLLQTAGKSSVKRPDAPSSRHMPISVINNIDGADVTDHGQAIISRPLVTLNIHS